MIYIISVNVVIVFMINTYRIAECQGTVDFSEKQAFLFLMNQTLCRLDVNDITSNTSNPQPTCIFDGMGTLKETLLAIDVRQSDTYTAYTNTAGRIVHIQQNLHPESDFLQLPGAFQDVSGICFDWMGKNLFWADHTSKYIGLYNIPTKSFRTLAILPQSPSDVAVDISTGRIFWSDDWPSISWTALGSFNFDYLITDGISSPHSLIVDTAGQRLFWTDVKLGTISSVDINTYYVGDGRRTLVNVQSEYIHRLAISEDFLFWTGTNGAHAVRKEDGQHIKDFEMGGVAFGAVFNGLYSQPFIQNRCNINNGGCSHICAPGPESTRKCLCKLGHFLDVDSKTCITRTITEDFILFVDEGHKSLYQINLQNGDTYAIDLPVRIDIPSAVAYDVEHNMAFFTDTETERLYKFNINNPNSIEVVHQFSQSQMLYGLEYDPNTQKLYINDVLNSAIYRIDTDGENLEHLIQNIGRPWGIALDIYSRKIYWTDWTEDYAKIMRADMNDGSNIETIVSGGMITPLGITIDTRENKIYWVDGYKVESTDLSGGHRTLLVGGFEGILYGVGHDRQHIYVSDMTFGLIYKIDKSSGTLSPRPYGIYSSPRCIVVPSTDEPTRPPYIDSRQNGNTNDDTAMYAGVGVTVVILVSIAGIVVGLFCWFKRKHRRPTVAHGTDVQTQNRQVTNGLSRAVVSDGGEIQAQSPMTQGRPQVPLPKTGLQNINIQMERFTGNINPAYNLDPNSNNKPLANFQPTPAHNPPHRIVCHPPASAPETHIPLPPHNPPVLAQNPQPSAPPPDQAFVDHQATSTVDDPASTQQNVYISLQSSLAGTTADIPPTYASVYGTCTYSDDTHCNCDFNGLRPVNGRQH